jgi:hypothetical protein
VGAADLGQEGCEVAGREGGGGDCQGAGWVGDGAAYVGAGGVEAEEDRAGVFEEAFAGRGRCYRAAVE